MKDNKLAIDGGNPVRTTEFRSRPFITEEMIENVSSLMRKGRLTRFIGSPVPGTNEIIGLKSFQVEKINDSVSFLGGPSVRKLESKWSKYHGVDYSIAVNSATSGLTTAIMAIDIGPGDEIICSPFSFTASATSIILANAIPVFADIDLDTFCLSPDSAINSITESTKAIMPIHWNSNAGDLDAIMSIAKSKELKVIEDASQSPLMLYCNKYLGTHGDAGVFSLNEPKNIMTGEGGIIVTKDSRIAVKCRLIRNHGEAIPDQTSTDDLVINAIGYNFRLVELLAEIGVIQLEHLPYLNKIRKENYTYLVDQLVHKFGEFIIPQRITHLESYFPYTAGFRWMSKKSKIHRNIVAHVLRSEGIPVASGISRLMSDNPLFQRQLAYGSNHCPFACHLYKGRGKYSIPELPNAKRLQNEEYLGFFQIGWPNTISDMDDIVKGFKKILANKKYLSNIDLSKTDIFISGR
ncbi:MAG: DegT/DnrJ/EryC1/StrS family aminotransferase [Proteobacteria bacterium]|nr:DegT/DnrJ/EryC1/StrS family aminotransferase [Pseudomonadota bacterium]MCG2831218.1 DegT/DnrJ/EryC1/StrS family aminotransferase [Desulfobacteraceae bacterium]